MKLITISFIAAALMLPALALASPPPADSTDIDSVYFDVESETVRYMSGPDTVLAYLCRPDDPGKHPGVIAIHEWWGLTKWVKDQAEKIASHGYVVLAIDLYRGAVASDAEEAHELMRGLPEDRATRDLQTAVEYLRSRKEVQKDKIASVGWCMGGSYSLQADLSIPDLAACIVCYGRLATEDATISGLSAPLMGIYGEEDKGIPAESVRVFEKQAKGLGRDVTMYIYPDAGHAFMNNTNKTGYNEEATQDAWKKIFAFLDSHLKPAKTKE